MATQACDANSLSSLAKCGDCLPEGYKPLVIIALLAQIAKVSSDANSLVARGNCFACLSPVQKGQVMIALLCQIVNGGGSGPPPPVTCSDADANAFLNSAAISDTTIVNAICTLVTNLKNAGVWALMDAIYPFVGGTSSTNSYNLKNPAAYQISWSGAITFNAAGVASDGANTSIGKTGLNPSSGGVNFTQNSACFVVNNATAGAGNGTVFMQGEAGIGGNDCDIRALTGPSQIGCQGFNSFGSSFVAVPTLQGVSIITRNSPANFVIYGPGGASSTIAQASTGLTNFNIQIPTGVGAGGFTLSFAGVGGGLTPTQAAALQSAVTTFNTSLGRN